MRSLISIAMLASVFGPLAGTAFAADLDYPPPPRAYYEPHPVPPAFVPGPVFYRGPRLYPRPILYPRPYRFYGRRPVVGVYGVPGPYADGGRPFVDGGRPYADGGYDRPYPREPRPYGEPDAGPRGYAHEADVYRHQGEGYGDPRGLDRRSDLDRHDLDRHNLDRHAQGDQRYGHYLSREEIERRADRGHGAEPDRFADRERGGTDRQRDIDHDRYADRARRAISTADRRAPQRVG